MMNRNLLTIICCFCTIMLGVQSIHAQTEKINLADVELKLHDNSTVKLSDLKGKVVLIDFWYRSCFPCLKAIPDLIKIQEEFKDDLVIIGINDIDDQQDIKEYFEYKNVNYLSTYKTDISISGGAKITAFPTTILYDKQGKIIQTDIGYSKSSIRSLKRAIKKVLKEKSS